MFDKILVPTDDSECARIAIDYAADLARRYDATVHVLNVVDARCLESAPHYEDCREDASAITGAAADRIDDDVTVEETTRLGVPSEEILECATELDADLVTMGTHGRTGVDRYLLGSVAEKVVRRSDASVLTVRTPEDDDVTFPYADVLVPTDGSEGANAAVDPAASVAGAYGATLHALSVVDTLSFGIDVQSSAVIDLLEERARDAVEEVEERAAGASVSDTRTAVEFGVPYREIRSYVDEEGIDLVMMGTHGRSGLPRYLLGSVAEKLVRTSPAPVMTVRRPKRA